MKPAPVVVDRMQVKPKSPLATVGTEDIPVSGVPWQPAVPRPKPTDPARETEANRRLEAVNVA